MTHHATPVSLDAGLRELRQQMAAAFTGKAPLAVHNPIAFALVDGAGRAAKDVLAQNAPRP